MDQPNVDAEAIVRKSMKIAGDICVYTNFNVTIETIVPTITPAAAVTTTNDGGSSNDTAAVTTCNSDDNNDSSKNGSTDSAVFIHPTV